MHSRRLSGHGVQLTQDVGGVLSHEHQKDRADAVPVASSGFGHGHESGHPLTPLAATVPEGEVAKDHEGTQRLLGQIVGRRDARVLDKREPFLEVVHDPGLKRQRFVVSQDPGFQPRLLLVKPLLFGGDLRGVEQPFAPLAMKIAALFHKLVDGVEEFEVGGLGFGQLLPIAGRACQVSKAFLFGRRR